MFSESKKQSSEPAAAVCICLTRREEEQENKLDGNWPVVAIVGQQQQQIHAQGDTSACKARRTRERDGETKRKRKRKRLESTDSCCCSFCCCSCFTCSSASAHKTETSANDRPELAELKKGAQLLFGCNSSQSARCKVCQVNNDQKGRILCKTIGPLEEKDNNWPKPKVGHLLMSAKRAKATGANLEEQFGAAWDSLEEKLCNKRPTVIDKQQLQAISGKRISSSRQIYKGNNISQKRAPNSVCQLDPSDRLGIPIVFPQWRDNTALANGNQHYKRGNIPRRSDLNEEEKLTAKLKQCTRPKANRRIGRAPKWRRAILSVQMGFFLLLSLSITFGHSQAGATKTGPILQERSSRSGPSSGAFGPAARQVGTTGWQRLSSGAEPSRSRRSAATATANANQADQVPYKTCK